MTAVRAAALLLWWLPTFVLMIARPVLFRAGYAYRVARADRLMEAGDLEEAERVISRLRREVEAYRTRVVNR